MKIVQAALEMEKIVDFETKKRKPEKVDALMVDEIEALEQYREQRRQGKNQSESRAGNRNKGAAGATRKKKPGNNEGTPKTRTPSGKTKSDGTWLCFKCFDYGKHYSRDCKIKQVTPPMTMEIPRAAV